MALTDKDIVITPNRGQSADPKVEFKGASSTLGPQTISLNVYPTSNGTLSFEGSAGQLFSITNTLTGTIYSVNDVSGIPSIEVLDTGLVKLAQYSGNVLIGTATDTGYKLRVAGNINVATNSFIDFGPNATWSSTLRVGGNGHGGSGRASVVTTDGNLHLDGGGSGTGLYLNYYVNGPIYATSSAHVVIHAGNYGSYALPLSGGTMTGVITTVSGGTAINFSGQSDSFGYNSTSGLGTYIKGTGSTYVYGGGSFFDGGAQRAILHAGNYNSYAPTLTGGSASGTWGISITGSAAQLGGYNPSNYIGLNGNSYYQVNTWIQLNGAYGLYGPTVNSAHFYPNNGSYGAWRVAGSRNSWNGIEFDTNTGNVSLMIDMNGNTSGFHHNNYGWQMRWNNGTGYINKNAYGAGTEATILDSSNYTNYTNGVFLRAAGANDGMNFDTTQYNTMYYAYIANSPNKPPGYNYSYGTIITFDPGIGTAGRAQFYVSHAGNDLIFRGGWNANTSWQTWNRVLTDQNYTSWAPSLTGSGASGTWGINITGSAGSAASVPASGITGQTGMWTSTARPGPYRLYRRDDNSNYSVQTYWTGARWRLYGYSGDDGHADTHVGYADSAGSTSGNAATADKVNSTSGYTHPGTGMYPFYNWGGSNGGANEPSASSYTIGISVGSHPSDPAYGFQIARNMWNTGLWTRGYDSGFGSWVRLLDSSNYNSYSPTLTGSGASGTWGINITGSSSYATSAGSSPWASLTGSYRENYDIGFRPAAASESYAGFRFGTVGGDANAGYLLIRNGSDSDVYTQNGITLVADTGWLTLAQRTQSDKGVRIMSGATSTERVKVTSAGDIQFVNGNSINYNTGRMIYGDSYNGSEPYNTGSIGRSGINVNQIFERRSGFIDVWASGGTNTSGSAHDTGFQSMHYWDGSTGYGVQIAGNHEVRDTLKFRWRSSNGINSWHNILNSANYNSYSPTLTGGGASGTWSISITGNAGGVGGYVVSTSPSANTIPTRNNSGYLSPGSWIQFDGAYGLYWPNNNNAHIHANDLSSYAPVVIRGSRSGYHGIAMYDMPQGGGNGHWMSNGNASGYYNESYGWKFFHESGNFYIHSGTYGGGTSYTALHSGNYTSYSPTLLGAGASGTWNINITGTGTDPNKVPLSGGTMTGTLFINSKLRVNNASGPSDSTYGTAADIPMHMSGNTRTQTTFLIENTVNSSIDYPVIVIRRTLTPVGSRFGGMIRFADKNSSGTEISSQIYSFNRLTSQDLFLDAGSGTNDRVVLRAGSSSSMQVAETFIMNVKAVIYSYSGFTSSLDIDCREGNYFTRTISSDSTFTFSNVPSASGFNVAYSFTLELTHTAGTVTWPASVKWPGNVLPSLTTGKTHLFMFVTDDGGSRWRGSFLSNYDN